MQISDVNESKKIFLSIYYKSIIIQKAEVSLATLLCTCPSLWSLVGSGWHAENIRCNELGEIKLATPSAFVSLLSMIWAADQDMMSGESVQWDWVCSCYFISFMRRQGSTIGRIQTNSFYSFDNWVQSFMYSFFLLGLNFVFSLLSLNFVFD